jgi:tetratricopeptide (TPR) repeat protein
VRARPRRCAALLALGLALGGAAPLRGQSVKVSVPLAELEAAVRRDSLDPVAHYNVAMGYWSKRRLDEAATELRQALELDSQFAAAYLALAMVPYARPDDYWRRLSKDKAVAEAVATESARDYRRAFLIDPLVDLRMLAMTSRPYALDWDDLAVFGFLYGDYRHARLALHEGKYEQAFGALDGLTRKFKVDRSIDSVPAALAWNHALAAMHSGRDSLALRDVESLVRREERRAAGDSLQRLPLAANGFRYVLACLKVRVGDADGAIRLLHEVLGEDVGHYMAHVQLARIYEEREAWPEAIAERRLAAETNAEDAAMRLELGITLAAAGSYEEADSLLGELSDSHPRDPRVWYALGEVRLRRGRSAEARRAFERYLAIAPSRWARQIALVRQQLAGLP